MHIALCAVASYDLCSNIMCQVLMKPHVLLIAIVAEITEHNRVFPKKL